jgi:signal transduction histidine kinase
MGAHRIVRGLRRNGEEFPIEASISQTGEPGRRFYTVILRDVTERVRNEEALALSRAENQNLALMASLAREQEKSRFARELHDELGQSLTALKLDVGWLRYNMGEPSPPVHAKLESMQATLDATVAAARRIASDLRPLMLDDLGLEAACDWLARNFEQGTGVPCRLRIKGDLGLEDPHATAVFRVLQESLTNAAKHAASTAVDVTLERDAEAITVTVRDNGRGFFPHDAHKPRSYGFTGLRERASLMGGKLDIDTEPGRGTVVVLRLPTPEPEESP